ncbi:MAG: FdtA/QdtA family cupin domain-containing protein [Gemmatimonadaceae bacterium]|nr:FdtA/QdtA family cupin domain-containing protein [Gemmatimonadaceae bacterium]
MRRPDLSQCRLLPLIGHSAGASTLIPLEQGGALPFVLKRSFFVHGARANEFRGGHANAVTTEALICVQGTVTATLDDGDHAGSFLLDAPNVALIISPMIWVDLHIHTDNAILLACTDTSWAEAALAYYRERDAWERALEHCAAA